MATVPLTNPMTMLAPATKWEFARVIMTIPSLQVQVQVNYYDADDNQVGNRPLTFSFAEMAGSDSFNALQAWLITKLTEMGAIN